MTLYFYNCLVWHFFAHVYTPFGAGVRWSRRFLKEEVTLCDALFVHCESEGLVGVLGDLKLTPDTHVTYAVMTVFLLVVLILPMT